MSKSKRRASRTYGVTASGTVITDAIAEALADEAERGFDVTGWPVAHPGRPSLTGNRVESPRVTFRVTPETRARAAARAEREGKSVSQVAREALEHYLAG